MTNENYLTVAEVAELLHTSTKTVYKYIKEGQLIAVKYGRSYVIEAADLEAFKEAKKRQK